jgi:hypothetical protein
MRARGSIIKRGGNWSLVVSDGRDPETGRRRQRWIKFECDPRLTVTENTKAAKSALAALCCSLDTGTFIDATKVTLIAYLRTWVEETVKPTSRPSTYETYHSLIENHIAKARIASLPLQKLRKSALETSST